MAGFDDRYVSPKEGKSSTLRSNCGGSLSGSYGNIGYMGPGDPLNRGQQHSQASSASILPHLGDPEM